MCSNVNVTGQFLFLVAMFLWCFSMRRFLAAMFLMRWLCLRCIVMACYVPDWWCWSLSMTVRNVCLSSSPCRHTSIPWWNSWTRRRGPMFQSSSCLALKKDFCTCVRKVSSLRPCDLVKVVLHWGCFVGRTAVWTQGGWREVPSTRRRTPHRGLQWAGLHDGSAGRHEAR